MDILIFKTSVSKPRQISRVKTILTKMPTITNWNFDLEDCDKILRIVANGLSPRYVENMLQQAGVICEELEY